LSEADVLNTFEVMAGPEAQSGVMAERVTDAELQEITAMHYEMLAAYTSTRLRPPTSSQCRHPQCHHRAAKTRC
jgi:hypothetical protein